MKGPGYDPPVEAYCHSCGGELTTTKAEKKRLGSIFSRRWQWHIATVCSGCGREAGSAVALYRYPSPSLIKRVLNSLGGITRSTSLAGPSLRRRMAEFRGPDGTLDLTELVAAIPFKAYGMKGHPLGLRLASPGYGKTGEVIDRLHFQYVTGGLQSGNPAPGERIIDIEQGPMGHRYMDPEADLFSIRGLVESDRDFYRDWNLERIQSSPKHEATVRVNGTDETVELASWYEPQLVALAHTRIGDHPMRVTSMNLSEKELLQCLATLIVLQDDQSALTQHIQDYQRSSQELRAYWRSQATEPSQ